MRGTLFSKRILQKGEDRRLSSVRCPHTLLFIDAYDLAMEFGRDLATESLCQLWRENALLNSRKSNPQGTSFSCGFQVSKESG